jgi:hypothetical protein
MKNKITVVFLTGLLMLTIACNRTNQKAEQELEQIKLIDKQSQPDSFYLALQDFVKTFPNYPQSAGLLYQTAEYYVHKPEIETAANLYLDYFTQYPDSTLAPHCLFSSALLHEHFNPNKAADLYKKFINTYPEDPLAADARLNIQYIGKDPNEILEDILRKNSELESK